MHRHFLATSKHEQYNIRERYKPANVHQTIQLHGTRTEKFKPLTEQEFRIKIRESANRIQIQEKGFREKIFYSQLDPSRRCERSKDKPKLMLKNCRQYLEFMENYILGVIKDFNQNLQVTADQQEQDQDQQK